MTPQEIKGFALSQSQQAPIHAKNFTDETYFRDIWNTIYRLAELLETAQPKEQSND